MFIFPSVFSFFFCFYVLSKLVNQINLVKLANIFVLYCSMVCCMHSITYVAAVMFYDCSKYTNNNYFLIKIDGCILFQSEAIMLSISSLKQTKGKNSTFHPIIWAVCRIHCSFTIMQGRSYKGASEGIMGLSSLPDSSLKKNGIQFITGGIL